MASKTEQTEQTAAESNGKVKTKSINAAVSPQEHFTFTTYCRVMDRKAGEVAGEAIRAWIAQNVNADDLRAAVNEQLGL